ncbi:hypothetical protein FB471_1556 [Amycolatopsis cihanbeyliensis]|uniref:WD40 repeat protein n=1 Tax=Amycolatopsis cihanbeyliensis TaxID=1128664 RepID=A0A542DFJ4_AMYCI|nr:hypothetical protein FB471_1556 [Amycolatopsis cihanbeyliensis]
MQAHRVALGVVSIVLVVLAGGGYVVGTALGGPEEPASAGPIARGDLLYVDLAGGRDRVRKTRLDRPDAPSAATELRCQRVYSASGTTVCLRLAGPGPNYEAAVLDSGNQVIRTIGLPGVPNRARVSESGNVVSWTTFVTGDSYLTPGGFSTRTGILDLRTGALVESLEEFTTTVNGEPMVAVDRNFWGVTVAADDRTFYATLASQNRTWLVKGDLTARTMRGVRQGAECPSLSPDGGRIAYKKRTGRLGPWALAVLDLRTHEERVLRDTAGIDDQAVWLNADNLAYGGTPDSGKKSTIFTVPADGSAPQAVLIEEAASPVPLR